MSLEFAESQTEQVFYRFFWGDKLISKYLKKKFNYVSIDLSSMWVEGIRNTFWAKKITQGKSTIFTKILNYSNFSCIIFFNKMSRYSHYAYCLQNEFTSFGLRATIYFGLELLGQFVPENHKQKIRNIHKDLNYTKFSWTIFYAKLYWYLHFTCSPSYVLLE